MYVVPNNDDDAAVEEGLLNNNTRSNPPITPLCMNINLPQRNG